MNERQAARPAATVEAPVLAPRPVPNEWDRRPIGVEAESVTTERSPGSPSSAMRTLHDLENAAAEREADEAARLALGRPVEPSATDELETLPFEPRWLRGELQRSHGEALPGPVRRRMERRFGAPFVGVRVHHDAPASMLSRLLQASAFTYGQDIYFAEGQYNPDSTRGEDLLAHELAHTLQQRSGPPRIQRQKKVAPDFSTQKEIDAVQKWKQAVQKKGKGKLTDTDKQQIRALVWNIAHRYINEYDKWLDKAYEKEATDANRRYLADEFTRISKSIEKSSPPLKDLRLKFLSAAKQAALSDKRFITYFLDAVGTKEEVVAHLEHIVTQRDIPGANPSLSQILSSSTWWFQQGLSSRDRWRFQVALLEIIGVTWDDVKPAGKKDEPAKTEGEEAGEAGGSAAEAAPPKTPPATQPQPKGQGGSSAGEGITGEGTVQGRGGTGDVAKGEPGKGQPGEGQPGKAEAEGSVSAQGGAPVPLTKEEREVITQFVETLKDQTPESEEDAEKEVLNHQRVLELLGGLNPVERADILRSLTAALRDKKKGEIQGADVLKALEDLKKLTPAQRQMLRTNKVLRPDAPPTSKLPEKIQLALKPDEEKVFPDTGKKDEKISDMQKEIDRARATIRKKGDKDAQGWMDKLFGSGGGASELPFFNEMLMFEGLLIGAGEKHPEIKGIAQEITHDMAQIRVLVQREIAIIIAEEAATTIISALLAAPTGGAALVAKAGRALKNALRLKHLAELIEKVNKVYRIADTVRSVTGKVKAASLAYQQFSSQYDIMLQRWERLQEMYGRLDAPESLDEEVEKLEAELVRQMEGQLDGKMGELLSEFYIPDDVGSDELLGILFNMPRGVNAFQEMLGFYEHGNSGADYRATLLGKAVEAGALLYPVVGYLAYLTQNKLAEVVEQMQKSMPERLKEWLTRAPRLGGRRKGHARGGDKEKNRERLSPKRRRARYDEADVDKKILDRLKQADLHLTETYRRDGGITGTDGKPYWTPGWFRAVTRRGVKKMPDPIAKAPIDTQTKPTKGTARQKITVPMPRIRLKSWDLKETTGDPGPGVHLTANPTRPEETAPAGEMVSMPDARRGLKIPTGSDAKEKLEDLAETLNRGRPIEKVAASAATEEPKGPVDLSDTPRPGEHLTENGTVIRAVVAKEKGLTEKDPIEIRWHKPFLDNYPGISIVVSGGKRQQFFPKVGGEVAVPSTALQEARDRLQTSIDKQPDYQQAVIAEEKKLKALQERLDKTKEGYEKLKTLPADTVYLEAPPGTTPFAVVETRYGAVYQEIRITGQGRLGLTGRAERAFNQRKEDVREQERALARARGKVLDAATLKQRQLEVAEKDKQLAAPGNQTKIKIGVKPPYYTSKNQIVRRGEKGGSKLKRTGRPQAFYQEQLNSPARALRLVDPAGRLEPETKPKVDMDHVIDLAFVQGKDEYDNLWPLDLNPIPNQIIDTTTWTHAKSATSVKEKNGLFSILHKTFNLHYFKLVEDTDRKKMDDT